MKTVIWSLACVVLLYGAPPAAASPAVRQASKVGEKTKAGAQKVVDKTKEGLSKTGEVITDGWITSRVHERFIGEDVLKGSDIHVSTDKHVVTLTGTVPSRAGRTRATAIAKDTEGVHRVVNKVKIGAKG